MAAVDVRKRLILLDKQVFEERGDFERILIHELFHFAWIRLSNSQRRGWECLLARELARRAHGELGWSAEWRKNELSRADILGRSQRWKHYVRESFCDTAAWCFAGLKSHDEFTLAARFCGSRQAWFAREIEARPVSL
jgi:hypothetical protein